jgi:hypothetical protein
MALTETKHHQVGQLVRELADYSRGLLSAEQMFELLGAVAFGVYECCYHSMVRWHSPLQGLASARS